MLLVKWVGCHLNCGEREREQGVCGTNERNEVCVLNLGSIYRVCA